MTVRSTVGVLTLCYKGTLSMECAVAIRDKPAQLLPCWVGRSALSDSAPGPLAPPLHLSPHALRVCTDHSPPFSAFSSYSHFPKSIYEGNFGYGYLKERRASGVVFCENTASVYRALFVSPPVFLFLLGGNCESVAWSFLACGLLLWNDMHAERLFLHGLSYTCSLCWFWKIWHC